MVWAETEEVGCAMVHYKVNMLIYFQFFNNSVQDTSAPLAYSTLVICNYATSGNFRDREIYKEGGACSACPAGYSCQEGLCAQ